MVTKRFDTQLKTPGHLLKTGFFHIFGATTISSAIGALVAFLLVRILSKSDYGVYSYALNIANFFILANGFGVASASLQICSERYEEKGYCARILLYATHSGAIGDIALGCAMVAIGLFVPLPIQGSNYYLIALCLYPLGIFLCEMKFVQLRSNFMNKEYAQMTNLQTALSALGSLAGAFFFGVMGLIAGQILARYVCYFVMKIKFPIEGGKNFALTQAQKKDFWGISIISCINNGIGEAIMLLGAFFVGLLLLDSEEVACYQVATTIPFALYFVPHVIVVYIYPQFALHNKDRDWTIKRYRDVILYSVLGIGLLTALFEVLAEPIIELIFGSQYLDAVPAFRVLMIGFYCAASIRNITGNLLVTQRKLLFNTLSGTLSLVVVSLISLLAIPTLGTVGAALAYTVTMAFGAVINTPYYIHTIRNLEPNCENPSDAISPESERTA